jgi:hypothetical protein
VVLDPIQAPSSQSSSEKSDVEATGASVWLRSRGKRGSTSLVQGETQELACGLLVLLGAQLRIFCAPAKAEQKIGLFFNWNWLDQPASKAQELLMKGAALHCHGNMEW